MKYFLIIMAILSNAWMSSYKGKVTDHYDGKVFYNPQNPHFNKSIGELLKWSLFSDKKQWPEEIAITPQKIESANLSPGQLSATFINHSTILIQMGSINILTDPTWEDRASPLSWIGPKRVRQPGLLFKDIPSVDIVLVSHNHYDHMSIPTLMKIKEKDNPLFIVGIGNKYYLEEAGITKVVELDWEQQYQVADLSITYSPTQHWSQRTLFDRNKALWGAFVIKDSYSHVYFSGDSGYYTHFKEAGNKYGPFDLSLLAIGAYEPRWFMKFAHMNPMEAAQAHLDLKSRFSIGIHFGTFQLANEGVHDPVKELSQALQALSIAPKEFVAPEQGQSFKIK